jgi:predicted O-methyltransferase YrrM
MKSAIGSVADLVLLPFVFVAGWILWLARRVGFGRIPLCRGALMQIGVIPIRRHYYEPFFSARELRQPLSAERDLPGIDWNLPAQLQFLRELRYEQELADLSRPAPATGVPQFRFQNGSFESGDAEFLYQVIRARKPRRIFEIGSGHSTLIAHRAVEQNMRELPGYTCRHVCIEPYENPWLEKVNVTVVRKKVEDVERTLFQELEANDLLFIDSSHVIRPQADVVVEFLEILPLLRPGVIVHVHDIFSPRDYPADWLFQHMRLWGEQYLLEGFLTDSRSWKILGALNLLRHGHFDELRRVCPYLTADREPGSFYLQKI